MPTVTTLRHANIPEAEYLGDLYGIRFDLDEADRLCEIAISRAAEESLEREAVEGLVAAAIVRYIRTFATGVRFRLSERIFDGIDPVHLNQHRQFDNIRNKFIAHPVNAFEDAFVTIGARVVDGVAQQIEHVTPGSRGMLIGLPAARNLRILIETVKARVEELISAETERLVRHIQSIPLDVVHSWEMYDRPHIYDPGVRRPRLNGPRG